MEPQQMSLLFLLYITACHGILFLSTVEDNVPQAEIYQYSQLFD